MLTNNEPGQMLDQHSTSLGTYIVISLAWWDLGVWPEMAHQETLSVGAKKKPRRRDGAVELCVR